MVVHDGVLLIVDSVLMPFDFPLQVFNDARRVMNVMRDVVKLNPAIVKVCSLDGIMEHLDNEGFVVSRFLQGNFCGAELLC